MRNVITFALAIGLILPAFLIAQDKPPICLSLSTESKLLAPMLPELGTLAAKAVFNRTHMQAAVVDVATPDPAAAAADQGCQYLLKMKLGVLHGYSRQEVQPSRTGQHMASTERYDSVQFEIKYEVTDLKSRASFRGEDLRSLNFVNGSALEYNVERMARSATCDAAVSATRKMQKKWRP